MELFSQVLLTFSNTKYVSYLYAMFVDKSAGINFVFGPVK